jgi:protein involved in polysaccharide export with SLBB domain
LSGLGGGGDRVYVPRLENSLNVVPATEIHMSGAVVLPSHWPWTNGLSLTAAITMVGGLTEYADGRVEVIRRGKGTANIYNLREIQSGRAQNPVLESGDDVHAQPVRPPSN